MATTAYIRNKAAEKLGILGEGESLRSSHSSSLDKAYLEIHDELENDGLVYWSNTADVPDAYTIPLISLVAEARATEFEVDDIKYQRLVLEAQKAWRTIWKLSETHRMGTTEIQYF